MARDLETELNEIPAEWPACWKPAPGEVLVATVRRYSTGYTVYGECRTVILQRDDGSRVSLWLSSTVLLDLFRRERPKVGERLGLKYLGKHDTKGYKKFALVMDRPEAPLDFAPLGGESGEESDAEDPFAAVGSSR